MKLKQAIKSYKNKLRQCPHCKSKKGFELIYAVNGNGCVTMDFKGKTISSDREVFDKNDRYVTCLNCNKSIETDRVQID